MTSPTPQDLGDRANALGSAVPSQKVFFRDSAGGETIECASVEEALEAAKISIGVYRDNCDPEWPDGVDELFIFTAEDADHESPRTYLYRSRQINVEHRPDDLDEDGYSESLGDGWYHDCDSICDYEMQPYEPAALSQGAQAPVPIVTTPDINKQSGER
jgi:hypothetical protein